MSSPQHSRNQQGVSISESYLQDPRWTRAIIESIGDGIIVADREGNFLLFNPAAERILGVGITNTKPEQWSETYHVYLADGTTPCPPEMLPLAQAIRGKSDQRELIIRNETLGPDVHVWARATPVFDVNGDRLGGVVVFHDITEKKHANEAMKRAERLISIGTLAAGVAHEINNPVGATMLTAEDALAHLGDSDSLRIAEESLRRILTQAQRCSEIVKRILKFASQQTTTKSIQDLRRIVDHAIAIIAHKAEKADVRCEMRLCEDCCDVWANPTELAQVFVNLLSNAIDASEPGSSITVSIESSAEYLSISVKDHGCGIDVVHHDRIFDAFYTTRLDEDAMGLGLSISHGIVTDHGGTILVNSRLKMGTTITVRIPNVKKYQSAPETLPDDLRYAGNE